MTVPERLKTNGREKDQDFNFGDLLYHGFCHEDFDLLEDTLRLETIRFPDFSCNWCKYSKPSDIAHRENGSSTDGCYSITVDTVCFDDLAAPVHDPIESASFPNYSHAEIRATRETDKDGQIPPKKRRINNKLKRMRYRQNIANTLNIMITTKAQVTEKK